MIDEFFLIFRDYACTKGSDDLKEKPFLMKMGNPCMFSKLMRHDNILFLFYVIFIGIYNFGDSRYLVLKIIVLVQIQGSPPLSLQIHSDITKLYNLQTSSGIIRKKAICFMIKFIQVWLLHPWPPTAACR